jgi:hypothetical protein
LPACWANAWRRFQDAAVLFEAFKTPNGFADDTLSFEAGFFDPDHWDEIDIMTNLNGAEKMFDGTYTELAARNGGTLQSRLGPTVRPHQYLCERPADVGCRK